MRSAIYFVLVCSISFVNFSFGDRDKAPHHKIASVQKKARLIKDGAQNPDLIPDVVAQELWLGSLVAKPEEGEKGRHRARAFAEKAGLSGAEVDAILYHALDFDRTVNIYNKEAASIKDDNWPNPSQAIWKQLRDLQTQKEKAIKDFMSSIQRRVGSQMSGKIASRLVNVKRQIKGFEDLPLPSQNKKISSIHPASSKYGKQNSFLPVVEPKMPSASTQIGDGTVYLYSDVAVSVEWEQAYGYGNISSSTDSYGHTYTVRTEVTGPSLCQFGSGGNNASVSIMGCSGFAENGTYISTAIAEQFCYMANSTNDAGSNSSYSYLKPFVRIYSAKLSPMSLSSGSEATIEVFITGSTDLNGLTGQIDLAPAGPSNMDAASLPVTSLSYTVNGPKVSVVIKPKVVVPGTGNGEFAYQVSIKNCTAPGTDSEIQGGCFKDTERIRACN